MDPRAVSRASGGQEGLGGGANPLARRVADSLLLSVLLTIVAGFVVAGVVTWALSSTLLGAAPWALHEQEGASLLDIVKVALAVAAGIGASVALVVNYRKQAYLEKDAAGQREWERTQSERYTAAATQLFAETAGVRLAGVLAMANLADDWPARRQQCVDILCTYLRLAWTPLEPAPPASSAAEAQPAGTSADLRTPGRDDEREVRAWIGRIIADHLRPTGDQPISHRTTWHELDFDFRHATLVDVDFSGAAFVGSVTFDHAVFVGPARLSEALFTGDLDLGATSFQDGLDLSGAQVAGSLDLGDATVAVEADLTAVEVHGRLRLTRARLDGEMRLQRCRFGGKADFYQTAFARDAFFAGARMVDDVNFDGATFARDVEFNRVVFGGELYFGHVRCTGDVHFDNASFRRRASFVDLTVDGVSTFDGCRFQDGVTVRRADFASGLPPELEVGLDDDGPSGAPESQG